MGASRYVGLRGVCVFTLERRSVCLCVWMDGMGLVLVLAITKKRAGPSSRSSSGSGCRCADSISSSSCTLGRILNIVNISKNVGAVCQNFIE